MEALPRLRRPADMDHLAPLMEFVGGHAQAAGLDAQGCYRVDLAAEEVLTNIIKYAYGPAGGEVEVACGRVGADFVMEFRDQGQPFDPLEADEPTLSDSMEDRPVGGLGIHLVRQVMDRATYQRLGDTNLLRLEKEITAD